jgi:site-specific DNA-cytosine methylase
VNDEQRHNPVPYGSMFSGAGLLDYGLHRSLPLSCEWAIESDRDRRRIFEANVPVKRMHADIQRIHCNDLTPIEGIVAGVPCDSHSTANTGGVRQLSYLWKSASAIIEAKRPKWILLESSYKDQSWTHWVPAVRGDLWSFGYPSLSFWLSTAVRGAPHERSRAFVVAWDPAAYADRDREPSGALHAALASLRETPVCLWDGRLPPRPDRRLDDGVDSRLARAIGLGVDQRTAVDLVRVIEPLL